MIQRHISLTLDWEKLVWALILLMAVLTRFYGLGDRVISHDESLHTYYSWELSQGRGFQHSPLMHGPFQFHAIALSFFMLGDSDATARVPAALFGVAAVALLWCFRDWLGRVGAAGSALLLTISPYLLYYSRYARNEAFTVVWALLMLLAVLRYYRNRKSQWLFLLAGVMALNHATKETAFIYHAIFMVYIGLLFIRENLIHKWKHAVSKRVFVILLISAVASALLAIAFGLYTSGVEPITDISGDDASTSWPMISVLCAAAGIGFVLMAAIVVMVADWHRIKGYASFDLLVVTATLVLPQLVALPVRVLLQADPLDYSAAGMWRSGPVLVGLLLFACGLGLLWDWRKWILCAGIFYTVYLFFFTTMFSNGGGVATGIIGSLGYWMEQQGVERGGQPWYYYALVQLPIYEYLPTVCTIIAGLSALRAVLGASSNKGNQSLDHEVFPVISFLGYWVVATLVAYTIAGEKMPWLTVHIVLPMILASGWLFGQWRQRFELAGLRNRLGMTTALIFIALIAMVDVLIRLAGINRPFQGTTLVELQESMGFLSALVVLLGTTGCLIVLAIRVGWRKIWQLCCVIVVMMLGLLTIRTSIAANYLRYDEQTEFINYASGAPGIKVVMQQVEEISRRMTDGLAIGVAYDDDVSWPFTWYLRNYPNQAFFGGTPSREVLRGTPLVIAGDNNWSKVEAILGDKYHSFEYIRMWWPMQDYFNLSFNSVADNLIDPARRSALWDIWFWRSYARYGKQTGMDFSLSRWPVVDRMRFYVDRELASQLWNLGVGPTVLSVPDEPNQYDMVARKREAQFIWGEFVVGSGEFDRPRDVAVGPDGYVYVADTFNHRIQKFDQEGRFLMEWGGYGVVDVNEGGLGQLNEPWGLTVSDDGFVYVADTWNHRVQKFTVDGEPVVAWGRFGDKAELENMWGPREVAIGPKGNVFVADTGNKRVSVFTSDGKGIRQVGSGGAQAGELDEPVGVAVSDDASVFIVDTWNGRVQVFNGNGEYVRDWVVPAWLGQSLDNKPYIAAGNDGLIVASDPEGYQIFVWDEFGNVVDVWGDYGKDAAGFDLPTGVSLDANGGLYVVDAGNSRLMYFNME